MATLINDPIVVLPVMHEERIHRWDAKLAKESPESLPEWLKPFFSGALLMGLESPGVWNISIPGLETIYDIYSARLTLLFGDQLASQLKDGELIRYRDDDSITVLRPVITKQSY